ncbi:S-adenosyl-L-methionine-dependent methyltransferase [Phlebopus sp. FC_14]|nr:S-adenosyl-L-methionine-dependent methyltransferase [Phlebopus sp. FC_14]
MAIELHNRRDPQDDDDGPADEITNRDIHTHSSVGDRDDNFSDASSTLTEVDAEEIPRYFREHAGRLFHSHGDLPYPLPVDGEEQTRLNDLHRILHGLLGSHYIGPVAQVLADEPGRQKRVLDLCTGTGRWLMDMASQFKHVGFSGVDIVPIATRQPLPNACFEILDATQRLRWDDGTMDFVHARGVALAVPNYRAMLREAARVLRPGGIFFSGEIGRYVAFASGYVSDPNIAAPGAARFYQVINRLLDRENLYEITKDIPGWLRGTGSFTDGRTQEHLIPIGDWHPSARKKRLGRAYLETMITFAESLKSFLHDGGLNDREIESLVAAYVNDLKTVPGMVGVYHTVWMVKA